MAFAVIGGLCALLLRSHVKEASAAQETGPQPAATPALAAESALAETAAAEVDGV